MQRLDQMTSERSEIAPVAARSVIAIAPDTVTARVLRRTSARAGFAYETIGSLQELPDTPEHPPVLVLVSCDGDAQATIEQLESTPLPAATTLVITSTQEHPQSMREHIARSGALWLAEPLDQRFILDLLEDIRQTMGIDEAEAHGRESATLDQCGLLRGSAPSMRSLYRMIRKVAPSTMSVLITGETGVGKELVAETIHRLSDVAEGCFLPVNCGAIPKDLIESELFGHERGSFSGATRRHRGVFERAAGGTLFLDEITEMPEAAQVKLLRVLETGRYHRVGGEVEMTASPRIVAASNQDSAAIAEGTLLRRDLYYRIAQFRLDVPPLRARGRDIAGLSHLFLHQLNERYRTNAQLTDDYLTLLEAHSWPGNVRELKSVIERAYVVRDGQVAIDAQTPLIEDTNVIRVPVGSTLDECERRLFLATLEANQGNKRRTAEMLGISVKSVYNRLHRYTAGD